MSSIYTVALITMLWFVCTVAVIKWIGKRRTQPPRDDASRGNLSSADSPGRTEPRLEDCLAHQSEEPAVRLDGSSDHQGGNELGELLMGRIALPTIVVIALVVIAVLYLF